MTDASGNESSAVPLKVEVSSTLEPVIIADRVSGAAPFSISVSATETAGLSDGDYINAAFNWNFDSTGVDSVDDEYEKVSAMIAGHVFTEPGTYVVTLDIIDKNGYEASDSIEIVVTDFDEIAGLKTYYFAQNGNDSNPGTMALPKRSMAAAASLAGANVKILFRKGDLWEHSSTVFRNIPGPFYWGAWEDAENPSDDLPLIRSPEVNGANKQVSFVNCQDIRVVDLRFEATGNSYNPRYVGGISLGGVENRFILLQGLEFYNMGRDALGLEGDSLTVYKCRGWDLGAYFAFCYRTSLVSFIGNTTQGIGTDYPEHVIRFADGYQTFIAFNHLRSWNTKSNIQMRGIGNANGVIYHNILDRQSGVNPTNSQSEEFVHHHVWDGNLFIYQFELEPLGYNGGPAINIEASNIVVRNNRLHNYDQLIRSEVHERSGRPRNIYILNNAYYIEEGISQDPTLIRGREIEGELVIRNNLVYNLSSLGNLAGDAVLKFTNMLADMAIDHNLFYSPFWNADVDLFEVNNSNPSVSQWNSMGYGEGSIYDRAPAFISLDVANKYYLFPATDGAQVDAGATVPVWSDLAGVLRPQGVAHDIGPWETAGDGNSFPVAVVDADVTAGEVPLEVNFSASGSSDPDEDPLTYEWDFDDGNGFQPGSENQYVVFQNIGEYHVVLRVSDGSRTDTDSILIVVAQAGAVTSVSVAPQELKMELNDTEQLAATVLPTNAIDKSVTWSSGNPGVATVDGNGLVTAVADGSTVITVTTNDGGFTANTSVVVGDANVALGKTVTVDSNHNASFGGSAVVDGNSSPLNETRWVSANTAWPHWVEIDLESEYTIERLRFWGGGGGQYNDPFDFIFQYWDGSGWINIVERTGNNLSAVEEVFSPVSTNRVRLYGTGGNDNLMRVYEIEVYAGEPLVILKPEFYEAIGAEPTGNANEYYSDWFGVFYGGGPYADWIWHEGFGWLYAGLTFNENEMWLWSPDMQSWLFTNVDIFPFFQVSEEGWSYYGGVWSGKGWRYDFDAMQWM